jgi:hypothetical protein
MTEPDAQFTAGIRPEHLASYVTGVIATLVAIGGLYLANKLAAGTAIAIVAAGAVAIWLGRTSGMLMMLEARGHMGSCVPEGLAQLRRSWPVLLAAVPPVLALAGAAAKLWSVTVGLHIGQAVGLCGLIAAGVLTARRVHVTGWASLSYALWPALSGLVVVGVELLSRSV